MSLSDLESTDLTGQSFIGYHASNVANAEESQCAAVGALAGLDLPLPLC